MVAPARGRGARAARASPAIGRPGRRGSRRCHLAENGLPLGCPVVVYGGGDWATGLPQEPLQRARGYVVAPDGVVCGICRTARRRTGTRPPLLGRVRVERVELDGGGSTVRRLVLAHGWRRRNVYGALEQGGPHRVRRRWPSLLGGGGEVAAARGGEAMS